MSRLSLSTFLFLLLVLMLFAVKSTLLSDELPKPDRDGVPESKLYDYGGMGPPATPEIVSAADAAVTTPMAPGPFQPTWDSIQKNYQTPAWFQDAKFGIFMHWGLYSVPAHGPSASEWYEKHMYASESAWHIQNYGPQEKFGYKDFIPLFTADKWDPDAWAALFKKAGAKYVMPCAEHHDNFALWNSDVTPFNAFKMGPKRDLIGDLAAAVRKQGLKFGVSNHGMENFTFINPSSDVDASLKAAKADLYDPQWADFYHVADRSPAAMTKFLTDWVNRNLELIDKYQPDILWFDNGVNLRVLDPLKLHVAAYYYNRAKTWGKEVSISTKYIAYAPSNDDTKQIGSVIDFEKVSARSPSAIRPGPWQVDDAIGSTWGYSTGMKVSNASTILRKLIDTVSKGGNYLLNISPLPDGTIPQAQQDTLLGIGQWLDTNGDAIYGTRPWTTFGDGKNLRYTTKGDTFYVIAIDKPEGDISIPDLASGKVPGTVSKVELLGSSDPVEFSQGDSDLRITVPSSVNGSCAFKITGLTLGNSPAAPAPAPSP